jgi:hypothetical protein
MTPNTGGGQKTVTQYKRHTRFFVTVSKESVNNSLFISLFNFAIIMHSWQGHHNSVIPIAVGPLNR